MRAIFPAFCLLALSCPAPAFSQECDPSDESQMGMNICADAAYQAEDAKLNKAYGEIVKRLSDDADGKKLLQTAQRAWIAFRDSECAFSAEDSEGGSIYPMLVSECLAQLTADRTRQLNGYLDCQEGDLSCPASSAE